MASTTSLRFVGSNLLAVRDDGSSILFTPTAAGIYLPRSAAPDMDGPGDNGGDGTSDDDDVTPPDAGGDPGDPDPITPGTGIDLYNPWKNVAISQSWESHIRTAGRGGTDYPLSYGTPIRAPGAGTLHVSGGVGEYAAGQVGSAGRRSILYLDKKFTRKTPKGSREAEGPMVAIVFQHQSRFGKAKHYNRGDIIGYTGASANGSDYGGDVHLHVHGLDKGGSRVDYRKFFTGASG